MIRMKIVERQNSLTDWDIITVADLTRAAQIAATQTTSVANTFLHKVEKIVSKAFSRSATSSPIETNPSPLNEKQYYTYLDAQGRIRSLQELRISIFRRGVDPILRRAVWKHLLNVYPPGLTGNQRYEYIKEKAEQYHRMKTLWTSMVGSDETVDSTLNMVRKDVLRTDRMHPFYSSSLPPSSSSLSTSSADLDNNPNVVSLLNILTTFALNHGVKYCQGMSDLASPLLYAMKDEAQAYICFCGLMLRLRENFTIDGEAISCKFDYLSRLLQYYDSDFYSYLKQVGAQDLLFCYRWILLELKREFPFDCALTMLEVLWSSIPPVPIDDLPLYDEGFRYDLDKGSTQDALVMEADLANMATNLATSGKGYHSRSNYHHQGSSDENDGDVEDAEDEDDSAIKSNNKSSNGIDSSNYQTNCDNKKSNNLINGSNQQQQSSSRKSSLGSSRNVKIPIVNRRYPRSGHHKYGDQFSLMNHSLPEFGTRTFECGDLENSGSIRINGLYLSHHIDHQRQRSSISASSATSNHLSSSPLTITSVNKILPQDNHVHNTNINPPNGVKVNSNSASNQSTQTTRSSLPHVLKGNRPLRTIRFLPKILSNDSREIDSPDAEESITKTFNFPPKMIDKGFSIDSDGDCRRLTSFESVGGSSKNSSVDIEEDGDPSATVNHHDLRGGIHGVGGLAGIKGGENNTSTSSSSSSSSAAVRLRCQQRRRLFCRLGSSGGSGQTGGGNSLGSFGRDNSEPSSPSSFHSGSFVYPNNVNTSTHEVETDCEQDLIVHCNGEYTDSRANNHQQDWIIPRGLARSVSYECLKNFTITPGSPTQNGETTNLINTININDCAGSSNSGLVILEGSSSNTGSGHHLNTAGLTPNSDTAEAGALLGSRNSNTQGLEKERSEGYGSGSDPSDLMSEVHSAFGGTLDGAKSDSSSCSSLVILNSNGSSTNESNHSPPPSSSSSSSPSNNNTNNVDINNDKMKNTNNGNINDDKPLLPSPTELGSSNAFMLFLCLTILLQHRDKIISSGFDCNEIAVYFDSYIRRHNVQSVLENGRSLFQSYLNQWHQNDNENNLSQEFPPTSFN